MKSIKKLACFIVAAVNILIVLSLPVWLSAQDIQAELILRLLPGDYYRSIAPGESRVVLVEVRNNGTQPVTDIRFSADRPQGWSVTFSPDRLDSLAAGSSYTVDVSIVPSGTASRGEYNINLIAEANETRSATSLFLRVAGGSSLWLWIGVGIAVVVAGGFILVFLRSRE